MQTKCYKNFLIAHVLTNIHCHLRISHMFDHMYIIIYVSAVFFTSAYLALGLSEAISVKNVKCYLKLKMKMKFSPSVKLALRNCNSR